MASRAVQLTRRSLALGVLALAATAAAQTAPTLSPEILGAREATRLLVAQTKPDYPPVAHANFIEGQVQMELMVGPDGRVRRAHVLRGQALLAASSLKAIRDWVYRPFVTAAGPAAFTTEVKVNFNLRQPKRESFPATPEQDLARRVTQPQVLENGPAPPPSGLRVRLRVLVGEDGRALDSALLSGPLGLFEPARAAVAEWKFAPARWGNLAVPWYLDVDVPAGTLDPPEAPAASEKSAQPPKP